jgi:DNA-binding CsgD family transcriptional regulator/tetratricopeptide (TPR) repeat protein
MVGRAAELTQLTSLAALADRPAVALISGEPGVGKTRLIQELVAQQRPGASVLAGQADPTTSRPFDLIVDVLKGSPADDGSSGSLVDLLDTVRDEERSSDDRCGSAVELVRQLNRGAGGLVVFEDIHWSDPESLHVLERLTEPDGGRLLVAGTFRPDALAKRHPATGLLPRLERRHLVTRVHLDRLNTSDVGTFLKQVYGRVPPFRIIQAIHSRTGGNPFFLEELIAAAGTDNYEDLESLPMPWTVAELVQNQVDELEPDVRRLVIIAAVLGRRVSFDVLAAVTQYAEDELIDHLHSVVRRGLLVETEPDYFSFRHELAREAVEAGLLGRKRRRVHEAALEALEAAGSDDHAALARHAQGAGRRDDVLHHARLGVSGALARGASYQALQLAELGLAEDDDDAELLAAATQAAWLAALLDDAADHADRWLALARDAEDLTSEAHALRLRIRVAFEMGDSRAMASLTDALVACVDRLPPEDRARAMAIVAQSYMLRAQVALATEWADKASSLAEVHDLNDVRLAAMVEKGSALLVVPDANAEGRALLEAAADEAAKAGEHLLAARAFNNLAGHTSVWHLLGNTRSVAEKLDYHSRAAGWLGGRHVELLAIHAAAEGDLDGALAYLEEDPHVDGAESWARARSTAVLRAGLTLETGDLDEAHRLIDYAKHLAPTYAISVVGLELNLACRQGRIERARGLLTEQIEVAGEQDFISGGQAHDLISAALPAGLTPQELQPLVDSVGAYAGHRYEPDHPWRLLLDAQLLEHEARAATATDKFLSAARSMDAREDPEPQVKVLAGQRASVHLGAARGLIALGRLDEARCQAETAAKYLARWRGWRVEALEAVQRRLGLTSESSGPGALTRREHEVATLLAEGLTNSELAERLFISPRTAAVHVSNILAKLGMASRTEVAAWVASGGAAAETP